MKMRIIYSTLVFFILIGGLQSQTWKVFESEEGKFSVLTPGPLEARSATVTTQVGDFEVYTLYLNPEDSVGNYLYLINYYDLPDEMIPKDSVEMVDEFFKNTMDQNISDTNGDLLYSNPIQLGIHPGLMWRSKSEVGYVKSRAFLINNRFYMLQVFSEVNKGLNNGVDKFLESFTLRS